MHLPQRICHHRLDLRLSELRGSQQVSASPRLNINLSNGANKCSCVLLVVAGHARNLFSRHSHGEHMHAAHARHIGLRACTLMS